MLVPVPREHEELVLRWQALPGALIMEHDLLRREAAEGSLLAVAVDGGDNIEGGERGLVRGRDTSGVPV